MWKIGDGVMYSGVGVCSVEDKRDMEFCGEMKTYLVLKPVYDQNSTLFVPTFNEKMMKKLYPVMSESEAENLLSSIKDCSPLWIDSDKERQERYREIIEKGERMSLVSMLMALHERLLFLIENKKRLRAFDEAFIKLGESIFEGEIAFVLGKGRSEIPSLIKSRIEN